MTAHVKALPAPLRRTQLKPADDARRLVAGARRWPRDDQRVGDLHQPGHEQAARLAVSRSASTVSRPTRNESSTRSSSYRDEVIGRGAASTRSQSWASSAGTTARRFGSSKGRRRPGRRPVPICDDDHQACDGIRHHIPRHLTRGRFGSVGDGTRRSMRANRRRDTNPELGIRRALHASGPALFRRSARPRPSGPARPSSSSFRVRGAPLR